MDTLKSPGVLELSRGGPTGVRAIGTLSSLGFYEIDYSNKVFSY